MQSIQNDPAPCAQPCPLPKECTPDAVVVEKFFFSRNPLLPVCRFFDADAEEVKILITIDLSVVGRPIFLVRLLTRLTAATPTAPHSPRAPCLALVSLLTTLPRPSVGRRSSRPRRCGRRDRRRGRAPRGWGSSWPPSSTTRRAGRPPTAPLAAPAPARVPLASTPLARQGARHRSPRGGSRRRCGCDGSGSGSSSSISSSSSSSASAAASAAAVPAAATTRATSGDDRGAPRCRFEHMRGLFPEGLA